MLVLRCMYGNRPDIVNFPLPAIEASGADAAKHPAFLHIAYSVGNGDIALRVETDSNICSRDVLARLKITSPYVEVENFVPCEIEASYACLTSLHCCTLHLTFADR